MTNHTDSSSGGDNIPSDLLNTLIEHSIEARQRAYAPYSKFLVGAAILGANGKIYTGGNIENQSYGLTICAERSAACAMVNDGCHEIKCIVVATSVAASPCGACRQFIFEFLGDKHDGDFPVYLVSSDSGKVVLDTSMQRLLPHGCNIIETLQQLASNSNSSN